MKTEMNDELPGKTNRIVLTILIMVFSVMALSLCFDASLGYDEFFSMTWVRMPWPEMWEHLVDDVHPPLHYIGLKLWMTVFGHGVFQARIFSWIAFEGLLIASVFVFRYFGAKNATWYLCLLFGNPFIIQKMTEIRMYMWASFWVLINCMFFYLLIRQATGHEKREKMYWMIFCISGLLAAYNHYFALLAVVINYAGLLIHLLICRDMRKRIKFWIISSAVSVIIYMPWLMVAISQIREVNQGYWIDMPVSRLGVIRSLFYSQIPMTEHIFLLILIAMPVLALVMLIVRGEKEISWWELVSVSSLWCIWGMGTIYMYITDSPILVSRYLIMSFIVFILGSSSLVKHIPGWMITVFAVFFLCVGTVRYVDQYTSTIPNTEFDELMDFLDTNIADNDSVCYLQDGFGCINLALNYYIPRAELICLDDGEYPPEEHEGTEWFFESDRMSDDERTGVITADMGYVGAYAFGSEGFKVWKEVK